jgi:hypothetical protein
MAELMLLLGFHQVEQLEIAANLPISHCNADVFEVLLECEQAGLVTQRYEPRERLPELMAGEPPGPGNAHLLRKRHSAAN